MKKKKRKLWNISMNGNVFAIAADGDDKVWYFVFCVLSIKYFYPKSRQTLFISLIAVTFNLNVHDKHIRSLCCRKYAGNLFQSVRLWHRKLWKLNADKSKIIKFFFKEISLSISCLTKYMYWKRMCCWDAQFWFDFKKFKNKN